MNLIAVFIALIFFYGLVSGRLKRTVITAPILFTAAGMLAFLFLPELRERQGSVAVLLRVAEISAPITASSDVVAWVKAGAADATQRVGISRKSSGPVLRITVRQIVVSEDFARRSGYEGRISPSPPN